MQSVKLILRDCKRKKISKLDLSNLELSFIPEEILKFDFIKELNFSNNNLITLEKKVLDLSNNQLISLPIEILELKNLKILKLKGNNFENEYKTLNNISDNFEIVKEQLKGLKKNLKTFEDEFLDDNEFIFTPKKQKPVQSMNLDPQQHNNTQEVENLKQKIKDLEQQLEKANIKNQAIVLRPDELQLQEGISVDQNKYISQGGFSMIYKKMYRGTQVALKKVFDPKQSQENKDEFLNEVKILNQLRHPYVINMMGYYMNSNTNDMQIIFEYVENNLYQILHQKRIQFDELKFLYKLSQVFNFMHQSKICHRDIKSLNILVTQNFDPKIIDFGLARKFHELKFGSNSFTATPQYSAPELFLQKDLTPNVDVYAFGVVMYEVLAKEVPYQNLQIDDIKKKILNGQQLQSNEISSELQTLINQCMSTNQEDRPDFNEIQKQLKKLSSKQTLKNLFELKNLNNIKSIFIFFFFIIIRFQFFYF